MLIENSRKKIENIFQLKIVQITKKHLSQSEMSSSSIVVAFYLMLSLFPLIIAVGNVLPFLNLDPIEMDKYIRQILPNDIYTRFSSTITSLLTMRSTGLLSVSAIATIWAASQGISSLQVAMNKAYDMTIHRNFVLNRLMSVVVLVMLFIVSITGVGILGFGRMFVEMLEKHVQFNQGFLAFVKNFLPPLSVFGIFVVMLILFYIVPNVYIPKLRYLLPGTFFTSVGVILLGQVFGLYAKYFETRVAGYQIIGSVIVLMLWLVFAARIIIIGSVINSVYQEIHTGEVALPRNKLVRKVMLQKHEQRMKK